MGALRICQMDMTVTWAWFSHWWYWLPYCVRWIDGKSLSCTWLGFIVVVNRGKYHE